MKQMPTVLFISPTVDGYIGGTETVVSQLAQRLNKTVKLTVLSGSRGRGSGGLIPARDFELKLLPFIGRDTRLSCVLSKLLMTSPFKIESLSFFRSLRRSGLDLEQYDSVVTFYEADAYLLERHYPKLRNRFRHLLPGVSLRQFFKRVPARDVFFFGYRAAPRAKRKWNVDIQSLPLGVDSAFFSDGSPSFPASRRLIFIGRLDKSKHVDWLVSFFISNGLAQRGYQLEIIGDGPLLQDIVALQRNSPGIVLHGRKRPEEVVHLLRGAFLLLHPSDLESFGLTILEGMAAGIPVITHELDSVRVWAHDHPRYAARLDSASWCAEIVRFENRSYWEQVSERNRQFAKGFTWDRIAEQVLAILDRG